MVRPLDVAGGGQQLRAVAHRGHGFAGGREVFHHRHDRGVHAQVLGAAPAGNHQPVVGLGLDVGEGGVEREAVTGFFAVGLGAFEIVDGGVDEVPCGLVGRDSVHRVAHGLQRLKRHHGFVVFAVVAADHQQFFAHGCLLKVVDEALILEAAVQQGVTANYCALQGFPGPAGAASGAGPVFRAAGTPGAPSPPGPGPRSPRHGR